MLTKGPTVLGQPERRMCNKITTVFCFPARARLTISCTLSPETRIQNRDTFEITHKCDPCVCHPQVSLVPREDTSSVGPVLTMSSIMPLPTKKQYQLGFYVHTVLLFTLYFGSFQLLFLINVLEILADFLMCKPVCSLAGLIAVYYLQTIAVIFSFQELWLQNFSDCDIKPRPTLLKC